MIRASKKTQHRRRMIKKLDDHARYQVFLRDDFKCVRCRNDRGIQWAHILSRQHLCIRWEPDNALTLCGGCHMFFWHKHPLLAVDWFNKNWPERKEHIMALFNAGGKVDLKTLVEELKG